MMASRCAASTDPHTPVGRVYVSSPHVVAALKIKVVFQEHNVVTSGNFAAAQCPWPTPCGWCVARDMCRRAWLVPRLTHDKVSNAAIRR